MSKSCLSVATFFLLLSCCDIVQGTTLPINCLNECLKLCSSYNGDFNLVQSELHRTFNERDSNQRPFNNEELDNRPDNGEKSVYEQEFSPLNKRNSFNFVILEYIIR